MGYKQSIFNIKFSANNNTYLYNTLSGSLLSIDSEIINYLDNIEANLTPETNSHFDVLNKKAIIVNKEFNEFGYIFQKTQHYIYNQFPNNVSYTIATTNKCNYNCKYCFEGEKPVSNCDIDADAVSNFIISQIKTNPLLTHIRITWFGGEPLLNKAAIFKITNQINDTIIDKNIELKMSIITNGSLLSEELIRDTKINSAQITLDGINEIYADYKGTSVSNFKVVMSNIKRLSQIPNFSLGLRINCDKNNIQSIFDLIKLLDNEQLLGKIYIYLAPIYTGTSSDLSNEEFIDLQLKYFKLLKENGYKDALQNQLHRSRIMSCGFMGYGSYVIDTDGSLKKCERDIGDKQKNIGDIYHGKYYNEIELDYQQNDILEKCHNCSIYPICRGGCRKMRSLNKNIICELEKNRLLSLLKMLVD